MFKFIRRFTLSNEAIEELAQETFLRAFKNLDKYDSNTGVSFQALLLVIAKNLSINHVSKKSVRIEKNNINQEIDHYLDVVDSSKNSEIQIQEHEKQLKIKQALNQLPIGFKSALVFYFFYNLSLTEIAEIEDCSIGTIKSRVFRAKQMLRLILLKEAEV